MQARDVFVYPFEKDVYIERMSPNISILTVPLPCKP